MPLTPGEARRVQSRPRVSTLSAVAPQTRRSMRAAACGGFRARMNGLGRRRLREPARAARCKGGMIARRRLVAAVLACAACAPVAVAEAAGPPLPSTDSGRAGAVAPGGTERLVAGPSARGRWSPPRAGTGTVHCGRGRSRAAGASRPWPSTAPDDRPLRGRPHARARPADAELPARRHAPRRRRRARHCASVARSRSGLLHRRRDRAGRRPRLPRPVPGPDHVLDYRVRALDTRHGAARARDDRRSARARGADGRARR